MALKKKGTPGRSELEKKWLDFVVFFFGGGGGGWTFCWLLSGVGSFVVWSSFHLFVTMEKCEALYHVDLGGYPVQIN